MDRSHAATAALTTLLRTARRHLRWHRRLLAALSAGVAVTCTVLSLSPPPPRQVPLLVAARDLAAGTVLGARDLRVVAVAPAQVPAHALASRAVQGQVLAGGVRRGEAITDVRLLGVGLAAAAGRGRVIAPVTLSEQSDAGLVGAGDVVDILAARDESMTAGALGPAGGEEPTTGVRVVARGARVLGAPTAAARGTPRASTAAAPLLVAVTPAEALALAGAATGYRLSWVIAQRQDGSGG